MTQPGPTSGWPPFRMCTSDPHTCARIISSTSPPAGGSGTSYSRAAVLPTSSRTRFRPVTMHTHLVVRRRSALRCRPLSKDRPLRSYANIFTPSRAGAHSLPDHHHPLTPDRTEIYLKVRRVPDTHSSAVARGHHRARNGTPSTKTAKQRE